MFRSYFFHSLFRYPRIVLLGLISQLFDSARWAVVRGQGKIPGEARGWMRLRTYAAQSGADLSFAAADLVKVTPGNTVNSRDYFLRVHSSDSQVFVETIFERQYCSAACLAKQLLEPHSSTLIVDVGANVGVATLFFSEWFPEARFILVEPSIENAELSVRNLNANGITNCEVITGAIWHKDAELEIRTDFRDGKEWSLRVAEKSGGGTRGIAMDSLLSYCGDSEISILKLDIEGAEFVLLQQPDALSRLLNRTRVFVCEVHRECGDIDEITSFLEKLGFIHIRSGSLVVAARIR